MNIADLFVRIRGDTSDVTNKLRALDGSFRGVEGGTRKAENALATYIQRSLGASTVSKELSLAIGQLTLGGGIVGPVVLGIGAVVGIYEKLTASARAAREEQTKLVDALKAQFAPKTGPRSQTNKEFDAALQERADLTKKLMQLQENRENPLVSGSFINRHIVDAQIESVQKKLADVSQTIADAYAGSISQMQTVTVTAEKGATELTFGFNQLREAAARVNAETEKNEKDWWRGYIDRTNAAIQRTQDLATQVNAIVGATVQSGLTINHDQIVDLTKPTVDSAKAINDAADKAKQNAQMIADTVLQSASIIVSALNIGGGGKGSNLGGALGSTAGFAAGMILTMGNPVGGAIGSTIGNVLGSLVGGLFDHKRALDSNTDATRQNTAMMAQLLNAPSGFKVAGYRYDATEIRALGAAARRYAARGGPPVFTPGT